MCKECQIPERLRRYLIGNPRPKDHKEDPSTDGRITSNRTFAKWRTEIGQLAPRIKRNGRRRSLRRPKLSAIKGSSAPGRRRSLTAFIDTCVPTLHWQSHSEMEICKVEVFICEVLRDHAILHPTLARWVLACTVGTVSTANMHWSGHYLFIHTDCQWTWLTSEWTKTSAGLRWNQLSIRDFWVYSAPNFMTDFKMWKGAAKWVPQHFK